MTSVKEWLAAMGRITRLWFVVAFVGFCAPVLGQIVLEPATVDFGRFKTREVAGTQAVTLHNTSNREMTVKAVNTGCGCVQAVFAAPMVIPAGERRPVKFVLSAAPMEVGEQRYPMHVFVAGADGPVARGEVKFEYRPEVDVSPRSLNIIADSVNVRSDMGIGSASVVVRDWASQPLKVESVSCSSRFMQYAYYDVGFVETTGNSGHFIQIFAVLPPGWPIGPINEKLTIRTNHPDHRIIEIPVKGEVRGPVKASPPIVLLGRISMGSEFRREIQLVAESPIRLQRVWSSSSSVSTEATSSDDGTKVVLKVAGTVSEKDLAPDGLYDQEVRIEFLRPRPYTQVVRMVGVVRPPTTTPVAKP